MTTLAAIESCGTATGAPTEEVLITRAYLGRDASRMR
jgi:hypothetical protein